MTGTKEGGKKAAATNRLRHGVGFYAQIGRMGGRNGHTGGFASMTHEQVVAAGSKGGRSSRRGAPISGDVIERIRRLFAAGYTQKEIAEVAHVSVGTISRILNRPAEDL